MSGSRRGLRRSCRSPRGSSRGPAITACRVGSPGERDRTERVAERAGVDLDHVSRFVEAGALVPAADDTFSEGDARRARLYLSLERAGLPMDALVEALERGDLSFAFLDLLSTTASLG
jgi:hypothetical protein